MHRLPWVSCLIKCWRVLCNLPSRLVHVSYATMCLRNVDCLLECSENDIPANTSIWEQTQMALPLIPITSGSPIVYYSTFLTQDKWDRYFSWQGIRRWLEYGLPVWLTDTGFLERTMPAYTAPTFVQYRLNEEEKRHFLLWWEENDDDLDTMVEQLCAIDIKVTLSCSVKTETYNATATSRRDSDVNYNRCLSSRAGDLRKAIAIMCYKHYVIFASGQWDPSNTEDDWG